MLVDRLAPVMADGALEGRVEVHRHLESLPPLGLAAHLQVGAQHLVGRYAGLFGRMPLDPLGPHAAAGPDRLGHIVGQGFSRGRRYQAAEDVSIAGVVIELTAGPMFGLQTPHQRQNASRNLVAKRFAVTINV